CEYSYYTYGEPIPLDTPLLADVMSGEARIESVAESDVVSLKFAPSSGIQNVWDQKLPMFRERDATYGFTRGYDAVTRTFNIYLMKVEAIGADVTALQVGGPLFPKDAGTTYYDPQITIDPSVCPKRYVMTMECASPAMPSASLCVSYSTTPSRPGT